MIKDTKYLWSSNMEEAYKVGFYMRGFNASPPTHIYKSRGSSYVVNGFKYKVDYSKPHPYGEVKIVSTQRG